MKSTSDRRARIRSERSAEITFACGASDGDDDLAFVLRTLGDFDGSGHVCAGGNADENSLFLRETTRHGERVIIADLHALDDLGIACGVFEVKVFRNETRASALNLVWAGFHGLTRERLRDDR